MGIYKCPYLEEHKILLSSVGLWPHQSNFSKKMFSAVYAIFASSLVIPVVTEFYESRMDLPLLFMAMIRMFVVIGCLGQFLMLHSRGHLIKHLYDKILQDWEVLTNDEEKKILYDFSCKGRTITLIFSISTLASYFVYLVLTYVPSFLDENESKIYPFYSNKWVVDLRFRNLQVVFHDGIGVYYVATIFTAVFSIHICTVNHICGMYAIVCYRLKKLLDCQQSIDPREKKNETRIISDLISIMELHKQTIRFSIYFFFVLTRRVSATFGSRYCWRVQHLLELFRTTAFIVEVCLLGTIAMLIYNLGVNITELLTGVRMILIAYTAIIHTFYKNLAGEEILQNSNNVFLMTHEVPWYLMSTKAKKMFLMIIIRSNKSDSLSAGFMTWSFNNFGWIMRISWSFASVLLSQKEK